MAANTMRDGTEEALREREITFAALARIAPVGIMRFDAQGRCNYVNDRWTAITGLTIDGAIGDGWRNAIHPDDRSAVAERWTRMREADDLFPEEYRICRPAGQTRWVLAEGAALRSYSGKPLGFIRTVTDITKHRELEAELLTARDQLEQRVQERTADLEAEMVERQKLEKQVLETKDHEQKRFSHDLHDGLGQCLTGMLFHALALERDLGTEQSPSVTAASKMAELANQAINQAYDLARGVDPVSLRPDGLMSALEELVRSACTSHPLNCSFECDEPVLVEDNAVATHLYRLAQEAMTNTIKHSKASQVTVRLERNSTATSLVIVDNGIGLPQTGNHKRSRGLNIIKHRARLIGAVLEIKGTPGRGTIVRCVFQPDQRCSAQ